MQPDDDFTRSHLTALGAALLALDELSAARDAAMYAVDKFMRSGRF